MKISSIERGEKKQSDLIKEVDLENSRSRRIRTSHCPYLQICPKLGLKTLHLPNSEQFPRKQERIGKKVDSLICMTTASPSTSNMWEGQGEESIADPRDDFFPQMTS